jgi:hypothetical protein
MYNGQFMKGFLHVAAFICLIWMASRFGPIMVPVFFAYFFYLVFDAYKTAHAIELGQPVPDPFGFERMFGPTVHPAAPMAGAPTGAPTEEARPHKSVPTGAVILIGLGILFLLHTVGVFSFDIARFFLPAILIGIGVWLLARRWGLLGSSGAHCDCERCRMKSATGPAVMITIGVLILLDNVGALSFGRTWPAIILVIGVVKLLQSNASTSGHVGPPGTEGSGQIGPPGTPPSGAVQAQDNSTQQQAPSSEVNHV